MANVTAVITTRNEQSFIASCIESILKQTIKPNEVILIDARSTDKTLEIASKYPIDKFYSVSFHDVYRSKRLGILLAKNDVVLCVDGDTRIAPDFTEKALKLLEKGYDVATGYVYPHKPNSLSNFLANIQNSRGGYLSGPAYLINRNAFLSTCQITVQDGLVDACEMSKEVPLQRFNAIKCPHLMIYTDLPSTTQKRILAALAIVALGVPAALFLAGKQH